MTTVTLNPITPVKPLTVLDVKRGKWFRHDEQLYVRCTLSEETRCGEGEMIGMTLVWCVGDGALAWWDTEAAIDEILPPNVTVAWERE